MEHESATEQQHEWPEHFPPEHEIILAWEALEKEHYYRGPFWYLGVGIFMILGVIYGVVTWSWTSVVVFILLAVVMFLYSNELPKWYHIILTEKGIHIGKKFLPYADIEYFWLITHHDSKKLYLRDRHFIQTERELLLHDVNPEYVRNVLSHYVKEHKNGEEHLLGKMTRFFKL